MLYRGQMGEYVLNVDIVGANGLAKANPQFGKGGMDQIFMSDFNELIHNKYITRVKGNEIKLNNTKVPLSEYKKIQKKIDEIELMKKFIKQIRKMESKRDE